MMSLSPITLVGVVMSWPSGLLPRCCQAEGALDMKNIQEIESASLAEAVGMFTAEFSRRYPATKFLIEGEGFEDEDLDLNVYLDCDEVEAGMYSAEVSNLVQQRTGHLILSFILPSNRFPL